MNIKATSSRWLAVSAWLMSLAAAPPCQAGTPAIDYHFVRKPSGADFAHVYPNSALSRGHGGTAMIRCRIAASGAVEKCTVLAESPSGEGFGAAAILLADRWQMSAAVAAQRQGEPFETTIRFNIDPGGVAPDLRVLPGDAAALVTMAGSKPRGRGERFDCPTAKEAERRCDAHPLTWAGRPKSDASLALLADSDLAVGKTVVECHPAGDGELADCLVSGDLTPKSQAAALAFAKALTAPAKAGDRTPVAGGRILFVLDWAEVRALRDKIAAADR